MLSDDKVQLHDIQTRIHKAKLLFIEQGDFIRKVVFYALSDQESRDEFYQDLFLYFVAQPPPEDVKNLRGFLYKVISDRAIDSLRASIRSKTKFQKYVKRQTVSVDYHASEEMADKEQAMVILNMAETYLTKKEAKAIQLRFCKQYDLHEIAEEMNIKPRSVTRYISVGIGKIRSILGIQEGSDHERE